MLQKNAKNILKYLHIEHMFITFAAYLKRGASIGNLKNQLENIIL